MRYLFVFFIFLSCNHDDAALEPSSIDYATETLKKTDSILSLIHHHRIADSIQEARDHAQFMVYLYMLDKYSRWAKKKPADFYLFKIDSFKLLLDFMPEDDPRYNPFVDSLNYYWGKRQKIIPQTFYK